MNYYLCISSCETNSFTDGFYITGLNLGKFKCLVITFAIVLYPLHTILCSDPLLRTRLICVVYHVPDLSLILIISLFIVSQNCFTERSEPRFFSTSFFVFDSGTDKTKTTAKVSHNSGNVSFEKLS